MRIQTKTPNNTAAAMIADILKHDAQAMDQAAQALEGMAVRALYKAGPGVILMGVRLQDKAPFSVRVDPKAGFIWRRMPREITEN